MVFNNIYANCSVSVEAKDLTGEHPDGLGVIIAGHGFHVAFEQCRQSSHRTSNVWSHKLRYKGTTLRATGARIEDLRT